LEKFLKQCANPLPREVSLSIFYQMLLSVEAVHSKNLMHRDIKPSNFLIDYKTGTVVLADFGCCRKQLINEKDERPCTLEVGSKWYKAIEILFGSQNYDASVDIWSLGAIFAELLDAGNPLFPGQNDID